MFFCVVGKVGNRFVQFYLTTADVMVTTSKSLRDTRHWTEGWMTMPNRYWSDLVASWWALTAAVSILLDVANKWKSTPQKTAKNHLSLTSTAT